MKMSVQPILLLLVATLVVCHLTSSPVFAQEQDAGEETQKTVIVLKEVVVEGEKRTRNLQDTTSSVAIFDDEDLQQTNAQHLRDIVTRMPNVQSTGDNSFSIRGIATFGFSTNAEQLIAMYLDGAFVRQKNVTPFSTWDMEQVEVFRGPQSTTQGRNALAGAILFRSKNPEFKTGADAQAKLGNNGLYQVSAAVTGPILESGLALRLSADRQRDEGDVKNTVTGNPSNYYNSDVLRAKLLWEPDSINGLSALLSHTYGDVAIGLDDVPLDTVRQRTVDYNRDPRWHGLTNITSAEITYALDDTWSVTSRSYYQEQDTNRYQDTDFGPIDASLLNQTLLNYDYTQEVRLNFEDYRAFSGYVGLYHANLDQDSRWSVDGSLALVLPGLGLDDVFISRSTAQLTAQDNYAAFADFDYALNDKWTINAGARYDYEEQTVSVTNTTGATSPLPPPLADRLGIGQTRATANETNFSAFLPKGGVSYHWTDDVTTSFTVQRGYRAGGSGSSFFSSTPYAFDPEFTWNYEVALRSQWLQKRVTLNANVFFTQWVDQQVDTNLGIPNDNVTVNAGESELYGFEIQANHFPESIEGLEVYSTFGYVNTEFKEFVLLGEDLSGNRFPHASDFSLNVGGNYYFLDHWFAGGNVSYRSDFYSDVQNTAENEVSGFTLVNAKVGYAGDRLGILVFGNNILNKNYLAGKIPGLGVGEIGDGVYYGIQVTASF